MKYERLNACKEHLKGYKLVIHPSFDETIAELRKKKIALPDETLPTEIQFSTSENISDGNILEVIGELESVKLNPKIGESLCSELRLSAYDESLEPFKGLEGTGYLTSHSLIIHGVDDYAPLNLITFYFFTRSAALSTNSKNIKLSDDPDADSKGITHLIDLSFC